MTTDDARPDADLVPNLSETRYFLGGPCPNNPDRQHMIPVRFSSSVPARITLPAATEAEVEWHWCPTSAPPPEADGDD